jgi:hypothetical protein
VAAFIAVQFGLGRFPAGIPYGVLVLDIEIFSVDIVWYIIVAVAGHAKQFGILIEGIAAAGVGDKSEELVAA